MKAPFEFTKTLEQISVEQPKPWLEKIAAGQVAHFDPETGWDTDDMDAVVMFGLPFAGNPNRTRVNPHTKVSEPWYDQSQVATSIGGFAVEWLGWHDATQCGAYRRLAPKSEEPTEVIEPKAGKR